MHGKQDKKGCTIIIWLQLTKCHEFMINEVKVSSYQTPGNQTERGPEEPQNTHTLPHNMASHSFSIYDLRQRSELTFMVIELCFSSLLQL